MAETNTNTEHVETEVAAAAETEQLAANVGAEQGGVENTTTENEGEKKVETASPIAVPTKEEILSAYLQEQGLTAEEISEFKKAKEEKNKPSTEEMAFADLTKYLIETKKSSKDEILTFEALKKADNQTLVFNKFSEDQKKSDPTLTDEDITDLFNDEYFIGSENEKLAKVGQNLLNQAAEEIRKPLSEKIMGFEREYVTNANMGAFKQQQETAITEFNKHKISQSFEVNGKTLTAEVDSDISFNEVKDYLTKNEDGKIINDTLFSLFLQDKSKSDELFGKVISDLSRAKTQEKLAQEMAKNIWAEAEEHFGKLAIGAKATFAAESTGKTGEKETTDAREQYKNYLKSL